MMRALGVAVVVGVVSAVAVGCTPADEASRVDVPPPVNEAQAAALEGPGWTGLTDPEEVIEARRVLMVEAERLMKPIDEFSIGEPGEPAALRSAATTLESLMLALPHLFPPTTNLFDPAAHDPPTVALRMRAACDICHASFMKPYTPPQVTDEDRNFDFESAFPDN